MRRSAAMMFHAAVSAALVAANATALAQSFEPPPSFNAAQIPGIARAGVNYSIDNRVTSDGILRVYRLRTRYGDFTVFGDGMIGLRIAASAV